MQNRLVVRQNTMFQHSYRGTLVWLFIVGMALGLTLVAGEVPTAAGAVLLAAYLALVWMVARGIPVGPAFQKMMASREHPVETSEVAREAISRARSHPAYDATVQLVDVGLIVDEQRPDGLALRRGRFISMDDHGIRPFALIHVPQLLAERTVRIRFELRNENGKREYVYETEKWLRAGENAILPDYRFPIRNSKSPIEVGSWTAHILVEGGLLGIHNFSLSPSLAARRRQMSSDGEMRERIWHTEDESLPLSLEELLRQQSRDARQAE